MNLTSDQKHILEQISEFMKSDKHVATLSGPAGTGKTYIAKQIVQLAHKMDRDVIGVAPTHKARKVLEKAINLDSLFKISTKTVAGLLNKTRDISYIGTKRYTTEGSAKISNYDLLIIDEASMISDSDVQSLIDLVSQVSSQTLIKKTQIVFIGDPYQVPSPGQQIQVIDGVLRKADPLAFRIEPQFQLTEIIRQSADNPLIDLYDYIRQHINEPLHIPRETRLSENKGVIQTNDPDEFCDKLTEFYKNCALDNLVNNRIIAYTNDTVKRYNRFVRDALGFDELRVGEVLMGYNNLGFPVQFVENGQDYIIQDIKPTKKHTINTASTNYNNLVGNKVTIIESNPNSTSAPTVLFLPDIYDPHNNSLIREIIRLAVLVNSVGSSKSDFRKYKFIKDRAVFTENLYQYDNHIVKERDMRSAHPLLFTNVSNVIDPDTRELLKNRVAKKVCEMYPKVVDYRKRDRKPIIDTEVFVDRFMIMERDIDFGYAITAHKAQGSTFHNVFLDETDFDRIRDMWNYKHNMIESRVREKNQLLYVAYTRPRDSLTVLYKDCPPKK